MKTTKKILLGALILIGLQWVLAGCIADVGVRGRSGGPWYHDGPWMDGGRYGGGPRGGAQIEIHPPGFRR
jgi:hypothetical protein